MLREVAPNVWVAQASRYLTTSTVIVGAEGDALLVDPAVTPADLSALAAAIAIRGWRIRAGFSTHPHWDHLLWSPELGDVPRWTLPAAAEIARARRTELLAEARADLGDAEPRDDGGAPAVVGDALDAALFADVTALPEGLAALPWSPVPIDVHPLPAHAPGSAALALTRERTLVVGDMLSDVEVPLLDLEAADPLTDYAHALDQLAALVESGRADVLIPGHGRVADAVEARRRIVLDRAYLADLRARRPSHDPRLTTGWLVLAHHEHERVLAARSG